MRPWRSIRPSQGQDSLQVHQPSVLADRMGPCAAQLRLRLCMSRYALGAQSSLSCSIAISGACEQAGEGPRPQLEPESEASNRAQSSLTRVHETILSIYTYHVVSSLKLRSLRWVLPLCLTLGLTCGQRQRKSRPLS